MVLSITNQYSSLSLLSIYQHPSLTLQPFIRYSDPGRLYLLPERNNDTLGCRRPLLCVRFLVVLVSFNSLEGLGSLSYLVYLAFLIMLEDNNLLDLSLVISRLLFSNSSFLGSIFLIVNVGRSPPTNVDLVSSILSLWLFLELLGLSLLDIGRTHFGVSDMLEQVIVIFCLMLWSLLRCSAIFLPSLSKKHRFSDILVRLDLRCEEECLGLSKSSREMQLVGQGLSVMERRFSVSRVFMRDKGYQGGEYKVE